MRGNWDTQTLLINFLLCFYAALLSLLGSRFVTRLQEDFGAKMFFNTLVPFEGGLLKYGVISRSEKKIKYQTKRKKVL